MISVDSDLPLQTEVCLNFSGTLKDDCNIIVTGSGHCRVCCLKVVNIRDILQYTGKFKCRWDPHIKDVITQYYFLVKCIGY